jgi:hypothetical protein
MEAADLVVTVIATTSLVTLIVVVRGGVSGLRGAIGITLEVIGATVIFLAAHVALGAALVLAARWFTLFYAALYAVNDVTLLVVALLQALTITLWRVKRS